MSMEKQAELVSKSETQRKRHDLWTRLLIRRRSPEKVGQALHSDEGKRASVVSPSYDGDKN